jgi:methylmalonyl-CoA mutase
MPVFGTMAARFNDDGVTALYQALVPALAAKGLKLASQAAAGDVKASSQRAIVPAERATWPRSPTRCAATTPTPRAGPIARERQSLRIPSSSLPAATRTRRLRRADRLEGRRAHRQAKKLLDMWPKTVELTPATSTW